MHLWIVALTPIPFAVDLNPSSRSCVAVFAPVYETLQGWRASLTKKKRKKEKKIQSHSKTRVQLIQTVEIV